MWLLDAAILVNIRAFFTLIPWEPASRRLAVTKFSSTPFNLTIIALCAPVVHGELTVNDASYSELQDFTNGISTSFYLLENETPHGTSKWVSPSHSGKRWSLWAILIWWLLSHTPRYWSTACHLCRLLRRYLVMLCASDGRKTQRSTISLCCLASHHQLSTFGHIVVLWQETTLVRTTYLKFKSHLSTPPKNRHVQASNFR